MKSNPIRVTSLKRLILMVFLTAAAKADLIETVAFTGTATCQAPYPECSSFPTGPLTGTYNLDVTTQTIFGPWSFSTPFGSFSWTDTGASAAISDQLGDIVPSFQVQTQTPLFLEAVAFLFPGTDPQLLGGLDTGNIVPSYACANIPGGSGGNAACDPAYVVTGSNSLVSSTTTPEPSSVILLGIGILCLLVLSRRRLTRRPA